MSRLVRAILVIGGERIVVEFSGDSAERIRRALTVGTVARRRQLERSVRGYLDEHPDASANEIVRVLGGNRQDVLAAVKASRARAQRDSRRSQAATASGETMVPWPGNQHSEVEP